MTLLFWRKPKAEPMLGDILTAVKQLPTKQEIQHMAEITLADVKAAVATAAGQTKDAIIAAVTTESDQVKAQIQALKDKITGGTPITQADLDQIVGSVNDIAPAAVSAIDAISTGDGADQA